MNTLPWLPLIVSAICWTSLPVAWWAAIDRRRWVLIRAYRRHRANVDARHHIAWAHTLIGMERRVDYDPYWLHDPYDYDDGPYYGDEYDESEGHHDGYGGELMSVPGSSAYTRIGWRTIETRAPREELL